MSDQMLNEPDHMPYRPDLMLHQPDHMLHQPDQDLHHLIKLKFDEYTYDFHQQEDEPDETHEPRLHQHVVDLVNLLDQAVHGSHKNPEEDDHSDIYSHLLDVFTKTRDGLFFGHDDDDEESVLAHKPVKKQHLKYHFAEDPHGSEDDQGYYDDGEGDSYDQGLEEAYEEGYEAGLSEHNNHEHEHGYDHDYDHDHDHDQHDEADGDTWNGDW